MAKQVNFTHPETGANYPTAYFRVNHCDIERERSQSVAVIYFGYANKQAADEGKQSIYAKRTQIDNFEVKNTTDFRSLIYTQETDSFFDGALDV